MSNPNLKRRGFGSMSPERRKELAAKGGKAIKPENRAFSRDRELASRAGQKGGLRSPLENKA